MRVREKARIGLERGAKTVWGRRQEQDGGASRIETFSGRGEVDSDAGRLRLLKRGVHFHFKWLLKQP